jgi:hypothetical protein
MSAELHLGAARLREPLPHRRRRRQVVKVDRYVAWWLKRLLIKRQGRATCAPGRPISGRATGSWSRGCSSSWAQSAHRGSRKARLADVFEAYDVVLTIFLCSQVVGTHRAVLVDAGVASTARH